MIRTTVIFLTCAAFTAACGGRSQSAKRTDPNYQVVQEGQASGVTSTINGPGETPPPLTDTNVDTTTAFTLPDNPAPLGTQAPGTIAGTLPASPAYPPGYMPVPAAPRPRPVTPQRPPVMSSSSPEQPPPVETKPQMQQPPPTDEPVPVTPPPPPPPTDTTATTSPTDTSSTTTTSTAPPPPPPPPV